MDFLQSSNISNDESHFSIDSLEDLLVADTSLNTKLDWSFYISENLGRHFMQYLKIITFPLDKENSNQKFPKALD